MPNYISIADAAQALTTTRRILVIGCSGGGKTTLSRALADRLDLLYVSLDRDVYWLPGWQKRDRQEQRDLIAGFVAQERWVMDGSGASSFDLRLPRADLVIWVRVPRRVALAGLAKRVLRSFGTVRPEMAPGCPEGLPDRAFLSYIWNFERVQAPRFERSIDTHRPDIPVVLTRQHADAARLLQG